MHEKYHPLLIRLATAALAMVYLVILAGAVVRATGSGMGCPDWPKCFGRLVPPADSSSLPENYRQIYLEKRKTKNERMAKVLRFFSADEMATKILGDPYVNKEISFNAAKAWVEYINRLLGVLLGFVQLALVIVAWLHRKKNRAVWRFSLLAFMLTLFEGWLGSIVVSTNLLPGTITVHLFLALGIMALMTAILVRTREEEMHIAFKLQPALKNILRTAILFSLVQIWMGTRVREQVDQVAARVDNRGLWIGELGYWFDTHRIIALAVLLLNGYLFFYMKRAPAGLKKFSNLIIVLVGMEIAAGIALSFFALPAFVQPIHLLLAVLIFGMQVNLLLRVKRAVTI